MNPDPGAHSNWSRPGDEALRRRLDPKLAGQSGPPSWVDGRRMLVDLGEAPASRGDAQSREAQACSSRLSSILRWMCFAP